MKILFHNIHDKILSNRNDLKVEKNENKNHSDKKAESKKFDIQKLRDEIRNINWNNITKDWSI